MTSWKYVSNFSSSKPSSQPQMISSSTWKSLMPMAMGPSVCRIWKPWPWDTFADKEFWERLDWVARPLEGLTRVNTHPALIKLSLETILPMITPVMLKADQGQKFNLRTPTITVDIWLDPSTAVTRLTPILLTISTEATKMKIMADFQDQVWESTI